MPISDTLLEKQTKKGVFFPCQGCQFFYFFLRLMHPPSEPSVLPPSPKVWAIQPHPDYELLTPSQVFDPVPTYGRNIVRPLTSLTTTGTSSRARTLRRLLPLTDNVPRNNKKITKKPKYLKFCLILQPENNIFQAFWTTKK